MRENKIIKYIVIGLLLAIVVLNVSKDIVRAEVPTTVVMTYEDKVYTKEIYSIDTDQIKKGIETEGLRSIGEQCDNLNFQTNGEVKVDKKAVMSAVKDQIVAGNTNIAIDLTKYTQQALVATRAAELLTANMVSQDDIKAAPVAIDPILNQSVLALGIDCKISEASTKFRANEDRAVNVRNAASKINGMILPPGGAFSADMSFGPRTVQNGYGQGNVISGGKYVKAMGGGICQVSSTLNLAVLRAGIIPTMRRNHSHRSSYIGSGLDATISAGTIDYQFINTLAYPILIVANGDGGVLTVSLYSNHDALGGVVYEPTVVGNNLNNTTYLIGNLNGMQVSNRRCYSSKYSQ